MPRSSIAPEKKEAVMKLVRGGNMTAAAISRETGVSEMTIANWKRQENTEAVAGGEDKKPLNLKEQVFLLETELKLERLISKFLRRYAKAETTEQRLEFECQYFQARLEIFGDKSPLRLSEQQEDEEAPATETE
jgi:transposase-like protein